MFVRVNSTVSSTVIKSPHDHLPRRLAGSNICVRFSDESTRVEAADTHDNQAYTLVLLLLLLLNNDDDNDNDEDGARWD